MAQNVFHIDEAGSHGGEFRREHKNTRSQYLTFVDTHTNTRSVFIVNGAQ
jgi:hypothetical protein